MTSIDGACPYCNSEDSCEHLLLQVDLTFRDAVGGELYKVFREKWFSILDANEDINNFDEREAFERLLEDVACLADAERCWEFEGGPGQSCNYQAFFCNGEKSRAIAINQWRDDNTCEVSKDDADL